METLLSTALGPSTAELAAVHLHSVTGSLLSHPQALQTLVLGLTLKTLCLAQEGRRQRQMAPDIAIYFLCVRCQVSSFAALSKPDVQ